MRLGQNLNSQSVEVQSRAKAWNRNPSWYFLVGSVEFHQTCGCAYRSSQCSQCKPSGPRQRLPCRMCSSRNSFYRPFRWMTLLYRIPAIYMHPFMHNSNSQLRLFDAMLASKSFLLAPCSFVRKRSQCHKPRGFSGAWVGAGVFLLRTASIRGATRWSACLSLTWPSWRCSRKQSFVWRRDTVICGSVTIT